MKMFKLSWPCSLFLGTVQNVIKLFKLSWHSSQFHNTAHILMTMFKISWQVQNVVTLSIIFWLKLYHVIIFSQIPKAFQALTILIPTIFGSPLCHTDQNTVCGEVVWVLVAVLLYWQGVQLYTANCARRTAA